MFVHVRDFIAKWGCKPKPPEIPSGQIQARYDQIQVDDLGIPTRLLLASRVVKSSSCNQAGDERTEQGFAAPARIVHELEEAEVERQFVLRDAPVWA